MVMLSSVSPLPIISNDQAKSILNRDFADGKLDKRERADIAARLNGANSFGAGRDALAAALTVNLPEFASRRAEDLTKVLAVYDDHERLPLVLSVADRVGWLFGRHEEALRGQLQAFEETLATAPSDRLVATTLKKQVRAIHHSDEGSRATFQDLSLAKDIGFDDLIYLKRWRSLNPRVADFFKQAADLENLAARALTEAAQKESKAHALERCITERESQQHEEACIAEPACADAVEE